MKASRFLLTTHDRRLLNMYDLIIIGAGVIGSAIAREISRYRLNVAVLEKSEEPAFGVSKSNSGIIHPGTQNRPGTLKGKLCVQGNRLTRMIAKELGIDFKKVGELIVALDNDELVSLSDIKREAEALGVPGLKLVGRAWLKKNEPNLTEEAVGALYAPTAGIISPYRWVYDLLENAKANGVEVHTSTRVIGIRRVEDPLSADRGPRFEKRIAHSAESKAWVERLYALCALRYADDRTRTDPGDGGTGTGNYFELATSRGMFRSRFMVNAAGLYADEVARMAGIEDFVIYPRKGEEFILDKKKHNLTRHLIFPIPTKTSKGILVIRTSDGNPMIGPTAQDVDSKEDLSTSEEGFRRVLESVKKYVPSIDENDIIAYFAGLRPASGDDFIIRHEDAFPGMVTVAGMQSPGLTAAPAVALFVRDILKKNGLDLRRKPFFRRWRREPYHLFSSSAEAARKMIKEDPAYGDIVCRCEMVSSKEIREAVRRGARTLDGIKFRTRAQAGRCHGGFCTARILKILAEETGENITSITKRGRGSEIVVRDMNDGGC